MKQTSSIIKTSAFCLTLALLFIACEKPKSTESQSPTHPKTGASFGEERGNGTDYFRMENEGAWFTGRERTVRYCISVSADFGVPKDTVVSIVQKEFQFWAAYIFNNRVKSDVFIKSELVPSCDETTDLRFYFGVRNEEVDGHLAKITDRLGAAVRTSYDQKEGWGNGFIWITDQGTIAPNPDELGLVDPIFPNWNAPHTLSAIVRHEIGHVYGNEHVPMTIMSEYLAEYILRYHHNERNLRAIDWEQVLVEHPTEDMEGELGFLAESAQYGWPACADKVSRNFEMLTGRAPKGKVEAYLKAIEKNPAGPGPATMYLVVKDAQEETFIKIEVFPELSGGNPGVGRSYRVFDIYRSEGRNERAIHFATSQLIRIHTKTGNVLTGTYEINLETRAHRGKALYNITGKVLKYLGKDHPEFLFFTSRSEIGSLVWAPEDEYVHTKCFDE